MSFGKKTFWVAFLKVTASSRNKYHMSSKQKNMCFDANQTFKVIPCQKLYECICRKTDLYNNCNDEQRVRFVVIECF